MHKRPILSGKLWRPPSQFSRVDQRPARERYSDHLSHQACALYLFLATVADAQDLSDSAKPALLICDELGYFPVDKTGTDPLLHVITLRYEQGAAIIISNRAFKDWLNIFNRDTTLTAAILNRLLHHADTIVIEEKTFRMKEGSNISALNTMRTCLFAFL